MSSIGQDQTFHVVRDGESEELYYTNKKQDAWLSDNESVLHLIRNARRLGLNRFVIWNLGGMDEEIFQGLKDFSGR